jgi:hypothetical protein
VLSIALLAIVREKTMPQRIDDARQWRARAEGARELAEQLKDPESKRIMLGIAASYVTLAQMAEERDGGRRRPWAPPTLWS